MNSNDKSHALNERNIHIFRAAVKAGSCQREQGTSVFQCLGPGDRPGVCFPA